MRAALVQRGRKHRAASVSSRGSSVPPSRSARHREGSGRATGGGGGGGGYDDYYDERVADLDDDDDAASVCTPTRSLVHNLIFRDVSDELLVLPGGSEYSSAASSYSREKYSDRSYPQEETQPHKHPPTATRLPEKNSERLFVGTGTRRSISTWHS